MLSRILFGVLVGFALIDCAVISCWLQDYSVCGLADEGGIQNEVEVSIIRWMCGFTVNEMHKIAEHGGRYIVGTGTS